MQKCKFKMYDVTENDVSIVSISGASPSHQKYRLRIQEFKTLLFRLEKMNIYSDPCVTLANILLMNPGLMGVQLTLLRQVHCRKERDVSWLPLCRPPFHRGSFSSIRTIPSSEPTSLLHLPAHCQLQCRNRLWEREELPSVRSILVSTSQLALIY